MLFELWPPAAGDDSDFRAVRRRGAEVAGGPPLLFSSAANMEDIPKMKWQSLIGRGQIWRTSVVVEQRSAGRQRKTKSYYAHLLKNTTSTWRDKTESALARFRSKCITNLNGIMGMGANAN